MEERFHDDIPPYGIIMEERFHDDIPYCFMD